MNTFTSALYAALWFETGGLFDPADPACVDGTDRRKCGTSGGVNDSGGNTKYGIAQAAHPGVDIDALDLSQAADIYHDHYWQPLRCDDMPDAVAAYVFNIACGSGVREAAILLQRCVGAVADGSIGPGTLAAVQSEDADALTAKLNAAVIDLYRQIVAAHPADAEFMPGWTRRANTYLDRFAAYQGGE